MFGWLQKGMKFQLKKYILSTVGYQFSAVQFRATRFRAMSILATSLTAVNPNPNLNPNLTLRDLLMQSEMLRGIASHRIVLRAITLRRPTKRFSSIAAYAVLIQPTSQM